MIRTRTKKRLILLIILIIIIYALCFGFLTYHEFKEWAFYPFFESMIGVFMGAGAIGLITGIILIFQSAIQSAQEKNKEVFDRKLNLYQAIIKEMNDYFQDQKIGEDERRNLFFTQLSVALLSKPKTFKYFSELIDNISDDEGNLTEEAPDKLLDFILEARDDLDVQKEMTDEDKENFNAALILAREEAGRMKYTEYQNTYIEFWTKLNERLENNDNFLVRKPIRDSYHLLAEPQKGIKVQAACTKKSSRIEINIDTGKKEDSKKIFDALYRKKDKIDASFGSKLTWERQDEKRTSRIYYEIKDLTVTNTNDWDTLFDFFIESGTKLLNTIKNYI